MSKETVTIKDVARHARVHPSTVSLCLNGSPLVAEKTRTRVWKAAGELGYRPHPHLKALMRARRKAGGETGTPVLGFVTSVLAKKGVGNASAPLRKLVQGARAKAEARGFHLEELWLSPEQTSREEIAGILQEKGISGILVSWSPSSFENLDWPWERLAAVAVGTFSPEPRLHCVRSNHFRSMNLAMKQCFRLGYRRPGLALPEDRQQSIDFRWMAAYLATQSELNLGNCPNPFAAGVWNRGEFLKWVRSARPDVVMVASPEGPSEWLKAAGYSIPEDIGIVALSAPSLKSKYSGIYEQWELQGERGVAVLIALLTDNEFGWQESPVISVVDGSWNPGRTLQRF